ncbi:MAG: hypothetical protein O3B72_02365 [Proteobacteria bacterium]|nr:hypothetical protein [Pseudomonadota bacterium]
MRLITLFLLTCLTFSSQATTTPEKALEMYFNILTSQDYHDISTIMDQESMRNLKRTMDSAMKFQAEHGVYTLQRRIFGEPVSLERIESTTPEFYLETLAGEILQAARRQHLIVSDRQIIGKIQESEDMIHIVARLTFAQDSQRSSDVLVYTLVKRRSGWKLKFPATIKQMITVIDSSARQQH